MEIQSVEDNLFVLPWRQVEIPVAMLNLNFDDFQENDYYIFSVFCLMHKDYRPLMLNENLSTEHKLREFNLFKNELYIKQSGL